jgi:ABC-type cobalamin/Fe3+-siderophores transport system ATPase subunit
MIRLQNISIHEFRGIRELDLDFQETHFGICGPNGTGKSGVVDAIEFALTGSITRLTGQGTSGISVRAHGPHVDSRKTPEKAWVKLTVTIPSLKKTASIERSVGAPSQPVILPGDADILAVFRSLSHHPEFALSRREILKYVLIAPGERAKEVQTLLRLDQIEKVRTSLQKVANEYTADSKRAKEEVDFVVTRVLQALGIAEFKGDAILRAVNERRAILGLPVLAELQRDTMLGQGVTPVDNLHSGIRIRKAQVLEDVRAVNAAFGGTEGPEVINAREALRLAVGKVRERPALLKNLQRRVFLQSGLDLIDEALCPFCDNAWSIEVLKTHIATKLTEADEAREIVKDIEQKSAPLRRALRAVSESMERVIATAEALTLPLKTTDLSEVKHKLAARSQLLASSPLLIGDSTSFEPLLTLVSDSARDELVTLRKHIEALPDPSKQDAARDYLVICQERLEAWRECRRRLETASARAALATKVFEGYNHASTEVLGRIYDEVAGDFSDYYRFINADDEATFEGRLTPSFGKLSFDVDFYKRGPFPPGAYHSEGHQDGMGLCLYLALMKHTLGAAFTFAVLDDVLMSVDIGHRKSVCRMLREKFPETQFVFTTHDRTWLEHMISEQMITRKGAVEFRNWSVEEGPAVWNDTDVWEEIDEAIKQNDIPAASSKLRRYLEYSMAVLAERLRAKTEYRADGQSDLGDLLPAVIGEWSSLLKKGKDAAQSQGQAEVFASLTGRDNTFKDLVARSQLEKWALNRTIHYNPWATLGRNDFIPVVKVFRDLLVAFECESCKGRPYVLPSHGLPPDAVKCDCGGVFINLKKRTGARAARTQPPGGKTEASAG